MGERQRRWSGACQKTCGTKVLRYKWIQKNCVSFFIENANSTFGDFTASCGLKRVCVCVPRLNSVEVALAWSFPQCVQPANTRFAYYASWRRRPGGKGNVYLHHKSLGFKQEEDKRHSIFTERDNATVLLHKASEHDFKLVKIIINASWNKGHCLEWPC